MFDIINWKNQIYGWRRIMKKNSSIMETVEKVCTKVAYSAAHIEWPYCTLILHEPRLPKKLKHLNEQTIMEEQRINCESSNL